MKRNKIRIKNCLLYLLVFGFTALPFGRSTPTTAQSVSPLVIRYNGPRNSTDSSEALAVDTDGNIYVTGQSTRLHAEDYATIKYDRNGNQLWIKYYNGPKNEFDGATDIAIDRSGNVYVTGISSGKTTSGSSTGFDYTTIKYDKNGNQLWVKRYNGPGNDWDIARNVAVDRTGNVYVTGESQGFGTSLDYATIKYSPNGKQLWIKRFNGLGNAVDSSNDLALDKFGNVYVTGHITRSVKNGNYDYDYATIKYSPNGERLWVRRYNNGASNNSDIAYDVAVDALGNVYVTGESNGFGTSLDYATIKYDTNGNQLWVQRYNGLGNVHDVARDLALDPSGNVYVTGDSDSGGSGLGDEYRDYATIKYDSNGNQLWAKRYNGLGNDRELAKDVALDSLGNVYVTGASTGFSTGLDYATIKYDSNGNQLWVQRYNSRSSNNNSDFPNDLTVDRLGNVYVTGASAGVSGSGYDYVTIKYDTSGN